MRAGLKRASISQVSKKALFDEFQGEDGGRFVHERVYRAIRHLIQSGVLANGDRLPSSRVLAESLQISRNSVLAAVDRLLGDGWLMARRSSGVYVSYSGPCAPELSHSQQADCESSIPFSLGWPSLDIFPVQAWTRLQSRRWQKMPKFLLRQHDRNGLPALRNAIAAYVTLTRGISCSPSQIFVASCIPAAIELAIRALRLSGEEFWVEDPCCPSTLGALVRSGIRVLPIPVDEDGVDVERGITFASHAAAAFVTPACQAPTGALLSDDRRRQLAEWSKRTGAWIFEDDFNWNGDGSTSGPPFAALEPQRTIYFNSFNHILFPGLRIAYLVSPPGVVDAMAAVRGSEGEVNVANQVILADFIAEGYLDDHLRRLNSCNAQRRAALLCAVERELSEYLVPKYTRGGYFICSLKGIPESEFLSATAKKNIAVIGMSSFELRKSGDNDVVLGFSQFEPSVLRNAAKTLKEVLDLHRPMGRSPSLH